MSGGRPATKWYFCSNCDDRIEGRMLFEEHADKCEAKTVIRDSEIKAEKFCLCFRKPAQHCHYHEGAE